MRALVRTGDPEALTIVNDLPAPSPSDSYYTILVHATALTRGELTWPEPLLPSKPIPGYDLAGTILTSPSSSSKFQPGDQVYALTSFSRQGNAREITVALEEELSLAPKNLSWEEAASIPLSALSAWQALFVHGRLTPPGSDANQKNAAKRVLITAASGGVGIWGIQLANLAGVEVVGTCGTSNVEFVKSLGASEVLDYSKVDLKGWVEKDKEARAFDIVLDCIGGQALENAWKSTRKGGRVISVAQPPDSKKPVDGIAEAVEGVWFIVEPNGSQLGKIENLVEQNKCKGVVDSVDVIEKWQEAFDKLEGGHAKGKVILKLA